jgi:acyl carrier protein
MGVNIAQLVDVTNVEKMRSWIASIKPLTREVGLDTDLINEGVLDSLEMVNFLLYIEELRGKEIPEALIQPKYFVTLRVICETFFSKD